MDRVMLSPGPDAEPMQIRTGHTPVNIGLLLGSLLASVSAAVNSAARSKVVDQVLPSWATYTFYAVLFISAAVSLSAIWRPLPTHLDPRSYRVIVSRLVRERVGLYGIAGILLCFSVSALAAGLSGATAACWLTFIAGGLVFRARQAARDVDKLHQLIGNGDSVSRDYVADPDENT